MRGWSLTPHASRLTPHASSLCLALLALSALIVMAGAANDLRGRADSPETIVRRYFAALEAGEVDEALQALAPSARSRWSAFVANGAGNEYRITGIAVRGPSPLDRLRGEPEGPRDVTVFLDITQAVGGERWQAFPRVPLARDEGRWFLAHPPLAAE